MKKALVLTMILLMLFALCACGDEPKSSAPIVGSWALAGLDLDGEDYTSLLSMFDIHLIFEPDGTGTLFSGEEELPLTWQTGTFSDGSDTYRYTVENDILSFESEGMTFIFIRG